MFSASWSVEHQAIARFQPHVDSVDNKIILSAENLIDKKTASVIVAIPFSITKWWSVQLSTTGVWQQNNALYKSEKLSVSETYINVNANMRFTMPADLSGELTGSYHGAELWGVTKVAPYGSLDIGIRKKLPQKWGSVIFNATNILNTIVWRLSTNFPEQNLVSHGSLQFSVPSFKLTYTRSFGNDRLKEKRERATGAEDEKRRVE